MYIGPRPGQIVAVQAIDIHGSRLFDVGFRLDGEEEVRSARLGPEALYGTPSVGDRVIIHLLMQTVTQIERANAT